jgi:hypothetical protein
LSAGLKNMFKQSFSRQYGYLLVYVIVVSFAFAPGLVQAKEAVGGDGPGPQVATNLLQDKQRLERLRTAIGANKRHAKRLLEILDVVGSGASLGPGGDPVIKVFTARRKVYGIPESLDGVRVRVEESGRFYALKLDTCDVSGDKVCETSESWPLPIPIGISIGHPDITAGTIGARVTDGVDVFVLSNNHVIANTNQANLGDAIIQPGSFDGGVNPADQIANLTDFEPIRLCTVLPFWLICDQTNIIDAAIALTTPTEIGVETPTGKFGSIAGYGAPSRILHPAYGNPNNPGDDDLALLLGLAVQKYGRSTGLTTGTVDTINATVNVCLDASCQDVARFVDQLVVTPGTFSAAGDSGSLIVTNDNSKQPVGLLFAGGSGYTVANRIDHVLNRFGVSIDDRKELSDENNVGSDGGAFYFIPSKKGGFAVFYLD